MYPGLQTPIHGHEDVRPKDRSVAKGARPEAMKPLELQCVSKKGQWIVKKMGWQTIDFEEGGELRRRLHRATNS